MIVGYLLFAFLVTAIPYMVYYHIIAPTRRLSLKYDLFKLRDRLRQLKIDHPQEFSDEVFEEAMDAVNGTMAIVDDVTILEMRSIIRHAMRRPEFREEAERQKEVMDACPIGDVHEIMEKNFHYFVKAMSINSLGGLWVWWPLIHITRTGRHIKDHFKDFSLMGSPRHIVPNRKRRLA